MVATASQSQQWSSPQNVQLRLSYPKTGVGATVSHVLIYVEQVILKKNHIGVECSRSVILHFFLQSSGLGRAYVTSGGIGYRQITIVVEANNTTYFRHNSQIYGY